jgi:hypothetical protein
VRAEGSGASLAEAVSVPLTASCLPASRRGRFDGCTERVRHVRDISRLDPIVFAEESLKGSMTDSGTTFGFPRSLV